jgi:hypothetical protein
MVHVHPWLFPAATWSLAAYYWLVAAAWLIWVWQRWRDSRRVENENPEADRPTARSYNTWVSLGMIGPACIVARFAFSIFLSDDTWSCSRISEADAQKIISQRTDARFKVLQYKEGSISLEIRLPDDHRIAKSTPWNDSLQSALAQKGIVCQTLIENRDFSDGGPRGFIPLLSTFIVVAGSVLLLRRPGTRKFYQQETSTPRAERREKRVLATCGALAMIGLGLLCLLYNLAHGNRTISGAEAARMISTHKDARFIVFKFNDGSKELWIMPRQSRGYYATPADESILALLAANNLSYETFVQGRDFGYRGPSQWVLWPFIFLLPIGAVFLLRWAWKKCPPLPAPAASSL